MAWLKIFQFIHLLQRETAENLLSEEEPATAVLLLALPDAALQKNLIFRLEQSVSAFQDIIKKADLLAGSGNFFAACLQYAAAACVSTSSRDRKLCLSLAEQYAVSLPGPELSGTAAAILRTIQLWQMDK